jgi:type II secretory pathway pseudopilin PulG
VERNLGDIASVTSLIISIIGFSATLWNVIRSKRAAEQAEQAVQKMRGYLAQIDTVSQSSSAIAIMDEVKRLRRAEAWIVLPDRYSALRSSLILIRNITPNLSDEQKSQIQSAIQHSSSIEMDIEELISKRRKSLSVSNINEIMSKQLDA